MYKWVTALLIIGSMLIILGGCAAETENTQSQSADTQVKQTKSKWLTSEPDLYIGDDHFELRIQHIYGNMERYIGTTIQYEGFVYYPTADDGVKEDFVLARYDGEGIAVGMTIENKGIIPKEKTWYAVMGIVRESSDEVGKYPYLEVIELTPMNTPGNEVVYS